MNSIDYQWPTNKIPQPKHYLTGSVADVSVIRNELESRFSDYFGFPSIFMPSGRAAVSLALNACNITRQHIGFAPKFSSHCIWNVLGRYSNPTVHIAEDTDLILAIHKYGKPFYCKQDISKKIIIEDSCDSLITNVRALFPNNGSFEIFSLPKIMGVYSGGVLVCANQHLADVARSIIAETPSISDSQGHLRWALSSGRTSDYNMWDSNEFVNFNPDYNLLLHIIDNFDMLFVNEKVIKSRIEKLKNLYPNEFKKIKFDSFCFRLPPVLATPKFPNESKLMLRHINSSIFLDEPDFIKMALIPLHFGVDEYFFDDIIKTLYE